MVLGVKLSAVSNGPRITFDILQLIDGKRTSKTKGGCSKILVCTEQYLYHKNRDHQGKDLVTVGTCPVLLY